jgi:hypothetical protein
MDDGRSQEEYIRQDPGSVLPNAGYDGDCPPSGPSARCATLPTGVCASVIEYAFVLAAARRLMRPTDAPPLGPIRSLAYFLPMIEEVLALRVSTDYFQYLRHKLERIAPIR